jgi:hypothetical protein
MLKDHRINQTVIELNNKYGAKGGLTLEVIANAFAKMPGSMTVVGGNGKDVHVNVPSTNGRDVERATLRLSYGRILIVA